MVPPSTSSPSYAPVARRHRVYRGGFRSSICDLFSDPSRRADCCALACCGILLSDRNRYLLVGERPLWCKRLAINILLPLATFIVLILIGVLVPFQNEESQSAYVRCAFWIFIALIIFLSIRGRKIRMKLRRELMKRLYDQQGRGHETGVFLAAHGQDIRSAHRTCCGCYPYDITYTLEDSEQEEESEDSPQADFCTRLFQNLGYICCGVCCQCWCQCFGMCAIGQEEREVSALVPRHRQLIDYMTFEPFLEYYPRIVELRQNVTTSFLAHVGAVSKLSKKLLLSLGITLALLFIFALTKVDKQFEIGNMLVLIATFLQAFFILYFVHWRWHRFNVSLDAIVKFFSSGFILGISLAMAYEWVLQILVSIVMYILVGFDIIAEHPEGQPNEDPTNAAIRYLHSHVWLFAIGVFLYAFVVAAVTEELVKYFSFWMCPHPDMLTEAEWNDIDESLEDMEADGKSAPSVIQTLASDAKDRALKSRGVAITISMVTAALGFACCENLMYVFSGSPSASLGMEAKTLLLRSIFPVHPLCAALQSIGVCRRDLEGNKSTGIGRIIFPAVLLHGTFDFVLMIAALIIGMRHIDEFLDPERQQSGEKIVLTPADETLNYVSMACGFGMLLIGLVYYVKRSCSQKKRLEEMETTHHGQEACDLPLVV